MLLLSGVVAIAFAVIPPIIITFVISIVPVWSCYYFYFAIIALIINGCCCSGIGVAMAFAIVAIADAISLHSYNYYSTNTSTAPILDDDCRNKELRRRADTLRTTAMGTRTRTKTPAACKKGSKSDSD